MGGSTSPALPPQQLSLLYLQLSTCLQTSLGTSSGPGSLLCLCRTGGKCQEFRPWGTALIVTREVVDKQPSPLPLGGLRPGMHWVPGASCGAACSRTCSSPLGTGCLPFPASLRLPLTPAPKRHWGNHPFAQAVQLPFSDESMVHKGDVLGPNCWTR